MKRPSLILTTILAGIMTATSASAADKDVNVINTPDVNVANTPDVTIVNANPIPIVDSSRPSLVTTSTRFGILSGQTSATYDVPIPACPAGEYFLITDLYAAPSPEDFPDSINWPAWYVQVRTSQLTKFGPLSVPIVVASEGHRDGSASVPGGQLAGGVSATVTVIAEFATAVVTPTQSIFEVHLTGYCGVPFTQP